MNTKYLMTLTAIFLGLIGLSCSFLPDEILMYLTGSTSLTAKLFLQLIGALYLAFAMLNWMSKASIIGGIYNRPIATANFIHFMIGSFALIKGITSTISVSVVVWIVAGFYIVFAIIFGLIMSRHPTSNAQA